MKVKVDIVLKEFDGTNCTIKNILDDYSLFVNKVKEKVKEMSLEGIKIDNATFEQIINDSIVIEKQTLTIKDILIISLKYNKQKLSHDEHINSFQIIKKLMKEDSEVEFSPVEISLLKKFLNELQLNTYTPIMLTYNALEGEYLCI